MKIGSRVIMGSGTLAFAICFQNIITILAIGCGGYVPSIDLSKIFAK